MVEVSTQQLADREAIKEVKARYCRLLDTKQWAQWRLVFADDARFESSREWDDPDEFVADVAGRLGDALTVHQVHTPEIAFTSPDSARVMWAMFDQVERPDDGADRKGTTGYGHYEEEYRRVNGEWKISFLRLTRLRIDALRGEPSTPLLHQRRHSPDWLTTA
jgi:hypothetical protein